MIGNSDRMTMTIDLPVDVVEQVRAEASLRGIQLEALLLEKIQYGVSARKSSASERPWMKHFGSLRNFHDERGKSSFESKRGSAKWMLRDGSDSGYKWAIRMAGWR